MLTERDYTGEVTCIITCSNLTNATKWYHDHLGFTLIYQVDELKWAELKTPLTGVTIGIQEMEEFVPQDGILTFSTPDIDALANKFDENEVKRTQVRTIEGMVRLMMVYDPDQNAIQFAESLGG